MCFSELLSTTDRLFQAAKYYTYFAIINTNTYFAITVNEKMS